MSRSHQGPTSLPGRKLFRPAGAGVQIGSMPLDAFFSVAVPLVIFGLILSKVALRVDAVRGIYRGPEGAARRDAINRTFRTNQGAIVIAGLFVVLWGLTVAGLVEKLGAIFFTFVIGVLLIIPFTTVCAVVIAIYMFAVHGYANTRKR